MSLRLAVFLAIPSVPLFALAHWLDLEWLIWLAMAGIMTAGIVFVFDQM